MKNRVFHLLILLLLQALASTAQKIGEQIFTTTCVACHSIGKGKVVGPDLVNVGERRSQSWLIRFIRSSQAMVKNGDAVAVKLFNEFNKFPMPDQALSNIEIKSVLTYIKSKSKPATSSGTSKIAGKTVNPVTVNKPKSTGVKQDAVKRVTAWDTSSIVIHSKKMDGPIQAKDISAVSWEQAEAVVVPVSPQQITYPNLPVASISDLKVKSLYFGNWVAFLITWADSTRDVFVDADLFCDQLAVQLPVDGSSIPSYMMGNSGGKVHIIHWKGIWQEDCERGFRDVLDAHPNLWVDVYPFQEGELDRSKRIYAKDITAEHIVESQSFNNLPGTYSKNPVSSIMRKEPVEEANATGFGTLATQETQQAKGWGKWENNQWTVCLVIPVNTGNINKAKFTEITKVSFAVWNGSKQNIGGRKHYSSWVDLTLK